MEPGPAPGFFVSEIRGLGRVVRLQPSTLPTPVRPRQPAPVDRVAQGTEQRTSKPQAAGSSPAPFAMQRLAIASVARAACV